MVDINYKKNEIKINENEIKIINNIDDNLCLICFEKWYSGFMHQM